MVQISDQVNPSLVGKIILVTAVDEGGFISSRGEPVSGGEPDFDRRKRLLSGHTIVVGRKTWQSLPENFAQNHVIIVVSKTLPIRTEGVHVVRSIADVKNAYNAHGKNLCYVLGGGEVAAAMLPQCEVILLTQVAGNAGEGTQLSFKIDAARWKVSMTMPMSKIADDDAAKAINDALGNICKEACALFPEEKRTGVSLWFTGRFLPFHKLISDMGDTPDLAGMDELWLKTYESFPAPRLEPFISGQDVTLKYLKRLIAKTDGEVTKEELHQALAMRMMGFVDISEETCSFVTGLSGAVSEVIKKLAGERRQLSHTYITLKQIEAVKEAV